MPRTAPAPNMIAIPGMNPGSLVAAGGGGGGGGSGGRGGGAGGRNGANGQDGREDPEGDGKGSGSCGPGSTGGCDGCGSSVAAGDPVDVATGRVYTNPITELFVPGPLPLYFIRKYSSHAVHRDVGLGFGWAHTFGWELVIQRRHLEVWDDAGTMLKTGIPPVGGVVRGPKNLKVQRDTQGWRIFTDGLWHVFDDPGPGGGRIWLSALRDRNGNEIRVVRDARDHIRELRDSVGRVVRVTTDSAGRITALEPPTADGSSFNTRCRYGYDSSGALQEVRYSDGATSHYRYDARHLLVEQAESGRPRFHFVWDAQQRCIESWGAFDDPSHHGFADAVSAVLADGVTPARGVLHVKLDYADDGYVEVIDSIQVRRFETNDFGQVTKSVANGAVTDREYDDRGRLTGHTDALGNITRWVRDDDGNVLTATDVLGNVTQYVRDADGNLLEMADSLGRVMRAEYDLAGNPTYIEASRGDIATTRYDQRGLPVEKVRPDGNRIQLDYDAHGNLVRVLAADGVIWEWSYDYLGRRLEERRPDGTWIRYSWDDRDRVVSKETPGGDVRRYAYDLAGDIEHVSDVRRSWRIAYNGLRHPREVLHPDGTTARYRFDREGRLTEVHNEKGEVFRRDLDDFGLPLAVTSFTGSVTRFDYDLMGRLVRATRPTGDRIAFERDAAGQVVRADYEDGTAATFTYDLRGQLVAATNDDCALGWSLDSGGLAQREDITIGSQSFSLEKSFNAMRNMVGLESSLGFQLERTIDMPSRRVSQRFDGMGVEFFYDGAGHETKRHITGGASLEHTWTANGQLSTRRLLGAAAGAGTGGEPPWVGPVPPGTVALEAFQYDPTGLLLERWDTRHGSQGYRYDVMDQLLERSVNTQPVEQFSYDATGNVSDRAAPSTYATGNILETRGSTHYAWDLAGRLVAKTRVDPSGAVHQWAYHWNGAGFLARVETPDSLDVHFTYDPFGRRLEKRVERATPEGPVVESATTFVWHGGRLLHEITRRGDEEVTLTYVYDSRGAPLAQRATRVAQGLSTQGDWLFYLNDHLETPEALFTSDGRVVAELQRSAWGTTHNPSAAFADTPLRFPGQYADPETGLHYNRYRYYDPEIGRYISEDPAGGLPDLNVFRYAMNPITGLDELGLLHTVTNASFTPAGGGEPVPLGNNGTITSNFDEQTLEDMQDPALTPHAEIYRDKLGQENGKSRACGSGFCRERFSDTEAKALREVDRRFSAKQREGGVLEMTGEKPPCSRCQARMTEWAADNNARVVYNYAGASEPFVVDNRPPSPG